MDTALMVKEQNFIWMLAYKENYEFLPSKPDVVRLAQYQRYQLYNFCDFRDFRETKIIINYNVNNNVNVNVNDNLFER